MLTDKTGAAAQTFRYSEWGEARGSTGTAKHRFNGKELDAESGLYYYGARYYSTDMARFISPDPIIPDPYSPQSLNRYSYVLNSPYNYTDPTGMEEVPTGGLLDNDRDNPMPGLQYWTDCVPIIIMMNSCPSVPVEYETEPEWIQMAGPWQPDWHRNRNDNQDCPKHSSQVDTSTTISLDTGGWLVDKHDGEHGPGVGNKTFRGLGRYHGWQCTYKPDGYLDTSDEYRGTYDICSIFNRSGQTTIFGYLCHGAVDWLPFQVLGN